MKDTLQVGLSGEQKYKVTDDMAPPLLPAKVLSGLSMLQLIEGTCLQLAQPHLDEGEMTVGVHVNISHTGPAMVGEGLTVSVKLAERERRRLHWEVEVRSPREVISAGTHNRVVIDTSRFDR